MFRSNLIIKEVRRGLATEASSPALKGIRAGLILSRTPIVTRDIPEFEQQYYNYQEELERRLMWTFPKWYYFKKGTVSERAFAEAQNYPIPKHRGAWFPKGVPDLKHGRDRRFKEEVIVPKTEQAAETEEDSVSRPIKFNPRITEADKSNDQTSIERQLPRTLYLLVNQENTWKFPAFNIESDAKPLHEIAEEGLRSVVGVNVNTWTVSSTPTAVLKYNKDKLVESTDSSSDITREYLIKSHIIAGKLDFQNGVNGVKEYKWLTKEEISELTSKDYYEQVNHLLADI